MKSDLIRQKFHELYSAGLSYADIVKELGICLRTLGYWAEEMGLPRRRGGPRSDRWVPGNKSKVG